MRDGFLNYLEVLKKRCAKNADEYYKLLVSFTDAVVKYFVIRPDDVIYFKQDLKLSFTTRESEKRFLPYSLSSEREGEVIFKYKKIEIVDGGETLSKEIERASIEDVFLYMERFPRDIFDVVLKKYGEAVSDGYTGAKSIYDMNRLDSELKSVMKKAERNNNAVLRYVGEGLVSVEGKGKKPVLDLSWVVRPVSYNGAKLFPGHIRLDGGVAYVFFYENKDRSGTPYCEELADFLEWFTVSFDYPDENGFYVSLLDSIRRALN